MNGAANLDRWSLIQEIFEHVLQCPPEERADTATQDSRLTAVSSCSARTVSSTRACLTHCLARKIRERA